MISQPTKNLLLVIILLTTLLTVVACQPAEFVVTFDCNGGSAIDSIIVTEDSVLELPQQPTRECYRFDGWYNGGQPYASDTHIAQDTTLTAQWSPLIYTITFNNAQGELVQSVEYTVLDDSIVVPVVPNREHYTGKWGEYTLDETDHTVSPVYTPITYTITFNNAQGELVQAVDYTVLDDSITEPDIPLRDHYTASWGEYTLDETDHTVSPVYTPITYTITFNDEQGELVQAVDYTVLDDSITEPTVPVQDHYTADWGEYTLDETNKTVSPVYTPITYTITFNNAQGELVQAVDYTVLYDSITEPDIPLRDHYTADWSEYTLDGTDHTVSPIYTPITYTITFNDEQGELIKAVPYTVEDSSIVEPIAPYKIGHTATWQYSLEGGDQTATLQHTINDYTLTLDTNGGDDIDNMTVQFDSNVSLPIPTRSGYVLSYWQIGEQLVVGNYHYDTATDINAVAQWVEATDGLQYAPIDNGKAYCISGYNGSATDVIVPSVYNGLAVTTIDNAVFADHELTSITLPFVGQSKVGANNTHFGYIFGANRYADNVDHVPSSLEVVKILEGGVIAKGAFSDCASLTNISIPDSVNSIGESAFNGCSSLISIAMPSSLVNIGDSAFASCSSLDNVILDNSQLATIGDNAFFGCTAMTSVVIPDSVISVGEYVFAGCDNMTIYCEASSEPYDWNANWDKLDYYGREHSVQWGYTI